MSNSLDDLAALKARLSAGRPAAAPAPRQHRIPRPLYLLSVDQADELSIVLVVRTGDDGVTRAKIVLPRWHELPPNWDGPHVMEVALPLAASYAEVFGYHAIAIDIESSQLWDQAWGSLSSRGGAL